jgi:O-antigen/teichoic acid export membrane protein
MNNNQKSYSEILKATSIFGGVQIFNIIIQILRSKFIAIILGPTGMGVIGLFMSAIGVISGLTGFGLGTSAAKIQIISAIVKKLMLFTGVLGLIITIFFSPVLSHFTFNNNQYTISFILLSITLLFIQLNSSNLVLLQGFRKIKELAKANMYGSFFSLIITIPLYFFFKINGIVPGIIFSTIIVFLFSKFYVKKLKIKKVEVSNKIVFKEGSNILKMGFLINLSGLLTVGASYLVRIYVSNKGGLEQVGLYNAGFAIINTYFGLILTAMSTDYYPRLASISDNIFESNKLINQQAEIAILIISPILLIFIIFIKPIIYLLYSSQFFAAYNMIIWASIGMFFKTATWAIGFLLLAKNSNKIYFFSELFSNIILLVLNILGYKYLGLKGLGISFLISYLISLVQVFLIIKKYFSFSFELEFLKIFTINLILSSLCLLILFFTTNIIAYFLGLLLITISIVYSIFQLNKRVNIRTLFKNTDH